MEITDRTRIRKSAVTPRIGDSAYVNAGYWFVGFIFLSAFAFYPHYWSRWSLGISPVIHVHAFLMVLWIGMLIAQPMLIKRKKYRLHRWVGRSSYLLVPLILAAAYAMMRYSYNNSVAQLQQEVSSGIRTMSLGEIMHQARVYLRLPLLYFLCFAAFYALAVIYRKRPFTHAQYMIAASLTLLGPTVDRIIYSLTGTTHLGGIVPIEAIAFVIAVVVLLLLIGYDIRKNYSYRAPLVSLGIFMAGFIAYFTAEETAAYHFLVRLLVP